MEQPQPSYGDSRMIGMATLAGCILCWGAVPVMLRDLADSVDAWTANGFRYPVSAILYWPVLWHGWRSGSLNLRLLRVCIPPALLALGGQVFWALSHYHLQASQIGFLIRFSMVWSLIASLILFRDERQLLRQPRFLVGAAMSACGFLSLSMPSGGTLIRGSSTGLIVIGLCSLFFGLYAVSVRRFLHDVHPVLAFAVVSQIVSLGLLVGMFLYGDSSRLWNLSNRDWRLMFGSSILGIAFGHILLYASVQRLGATLTTSSLSITPFVTVLLAGMMLGEVLTPWQWMAGLVMTLGAAALLSVPPMINEPAVENEV